MRNLSNEPKTSRTHEAGGSSFAPAFTLLQNKNYTCRESSNRKREKDYFLFHSFLATNILDSVCLTHCYSCTHLASPFLLAGLERKTFKSLFQMSFGVRTKRNEDTSSSLWVKTDICDCSGCVWKYCHLLFMSHSPFSLTLTLWSKLHRHSLSSFTNEKIQPVRWWLE